MRWQPSLVLLMLVLAQIGADDALPNSHRYVIHGLPECAFTDGDTRYVLGMATDLFIDKFGEPDKKAITKFGTELSYLPSRGIWVACVDDKVARVLFRLLPPKNGPEKDFPRASAITLQGIAASCSMDEVEARFGKPSKKYVGKTTSTMWYAGATFLFDNERGLNAITLHFASDDR